MAEIPTSRVQAVLHQEARYCAHNYAPLPVVLTRGQGVRLWDVDGREYLDFMSGYSATSFGHAHPRLVEVLSRQASTLALTSRAFHSDRFGLFAQTLCKLVGLPRVLPMNTGAEAVETAIKAARKWAYAVKGVPEGQAQIIVCDGNFGGRTTTIVSFSSEPQYRAGFGPYTPGFVSVPYGDAKALAAAITPHTAAFLVEPIQGEGGIRVPPAGYLAAAADVCRSRNVLFIADEVQTGLGRTGAVLACDHEGVRPDGLVLGKALGGGLLPVSAFLACEEVMNVFTPGDHGSTFGGNPLACAVATEALTLLMQEQLPTRAARLGEHALEALRAIRHPAIRDVRGRGLLIGIDLDPEIISAREFCERLSRKGVLTKDTHDTVVRIAPPLVMSLDDLDRGLGIVRAVFDEIAINPAAVPVVASGRDTAVV
ncbi:MAG TPA: ornithine--oxo-acid transaminase [Burkholderiaceae bacterium]|nr:ornithine--oxo-acid transaminase [Burkholderiaceae bacterium]